MKDLKSTIAIGLAAAALVVSLVRGRASAPAGSACVDQSARDRAEQLARQVQSRDAQIAQLTRALSSRPADATIATSPSTPAPQEPGIRRYAHVDTGNPAVTVTQKPDGVFDIRSTDPKLSGTVIVVSAVTTTGDEDKMYVRIPDATN